MFASFCGMVSLFFLFPIKLAGESCPDLARRIRLDKTASTLDIDELVRVYHAGLNWELELANLTYTVDLSSFENINTIQSSRERGAKFAYLRKFTTEMIGSDISYLNMIYFINANNLTNITARIRIKNVSKINYLFLNHNEYLVEVPDRSLSLLRNLTHLNLAWNGLRALSEESFYGLDQLTHLDLSNNPPIHGDLSCFCAASRLLELNLAFTFAPQMYAFPMMNCMPRLRVLNMARPGGFIQNFIRLDLFEKWTDLTFLDLSGVDLEYGFGAAIRNLNLTDLKIDSQQMEENKSPGLFMFLNRLENLDISKTTSFYFSIKWLDKSIFRGLSNLKSLAIRRHMLYSWYLDEGVFCEIPTLAELDLSQNSLEAEVMSKLSCLIETLQRLNLERNAIALVSPASANLSAFRRLRDLNLAINAQVNLSWSFFEGLGQLKRLNLSSDSIDGLKAQSFRGLHALEELDLSDNYIRVIENTTFTPLAKLTWLNLKGNELKNLFFFGLDYRCKIFLDGLLVFNISMIDLSQMNHERQQGFVVKRMHRKNLSTHILVVRNIKVNWKSASVRPNCSLYFHVLRNFKPISFELDQPYLDVCLSETLSWSPDRWAYHLDQLPSRAVISPNTVNLEPIQTEYSANDSEYLASIDSFLIGVNYRLGELFSIKYNGSGIVKYTFKIDKEITEFTTACDTVLRSRSTRGYLLWNMTDKTKITPLSYVESTNSQVYCLISNVFIKFDWSRGNLFSGYDLDDMYRFDEVSNPSTPVIVFFRDRFALPQKQSISLWNLQGDSFGRSFTITEIKCDELVPGIGNYFLRICSSRSIQIWKLIDNQLKVLWTIDGYFESDSYAMFRVNGQHQIMMAAYKQGGRSVQIWSVRFGKKLDELPFPTRGYGRLVGSDDSMLYAHYYSNGMSIGFF